MEYTRIYIYREILKNAAYTFVYRSSSAIITNIILKIKRELSWDWKSGQKLFGANKHKDIDRPTQLNSSRDLRGLGIL